MITILTGRSRLVLGSCLAALLPATAYAHALSSTPYVMPVPFWMYVYGCAATLVVSFAVLSYFWNAPALARGVAGGERATTAVSHGWQWVFRLLQVGAVGCLLLTIGAGLVGTGDPGRNVNMLLFWVLFLLGFTYLTVLVGDLYCLVNPWRALVGWLERAGFDLSRPRVRYPQAAGYWPARNRFHHTIDHRQLNYQARMVAHHLKSPGTSDRVHQLPTGTPLDQFIYGALVAYRDGCGIS